MSTVREHAAVIVVGVVALVIVGAAVVLLLDYRSTDTDENDDLLMMAEATLTASASNSSPANSPSGTSTIADGGSGVAQPTFSGVCQVSPSQDQPPTTITASSDITASSEFDTWYGEGNLWVAPVSPPSNGETGSVPVDDWYAGGLMQLIWLGTESPVEVSGTQLDGDAVLNVIGSRSQGPSSYLTAIEIPESGCWLISGESEGSTLTITIETTPITERADYVAARDARENQQPWPVPQSCPTTQWEIQDRSGQFAAQWWTDSGELSLGDVDGVLWQGVNSIMWSTGVSTERGYDFKVEARSIDTEDHFEYSINIQFPQFEGSLEFPSAGCWSLSVAEQAQSLELTVYVYPESCRPISEGGPTPVACEAP